MKERKTISIPLLPLIVVVVATIWVGFAIGSVFITGAYIWLAVILGAGVVGGGILYFTLAAETPRVPEIDKLSKNVAQWRQTSESTLAEHTEQLQRLEDTTESTQQALQKFSLSIAEYAEQLRVHTAAVRDLSGAAQELRQAAHEQNKVLGLLQGAIAEQPTKPQGEKKPAAQEYVTKAEYAEELHIQTAAFKELSEAAQELREAAQEQNRLLSLVKGAIAEQPTDPQGEENPAAQEYVTKAEYAEQLRIHTAAIKDLSEASQELRQAAQEQSKMLSLMQESITEEAKSQVEIKALLRSLSGSELSPSPPWEHNNEEVPRIPWGWQLGGAGSGTDQHWEHKDGKPRIPWGWELGRFA